MNTYRLVNCLRPHVTLPLCFTCDRVTFLCTTNLGLAKLRYWIFESMTDSQKPPKTDVVLRSRALIKKGNYKWPAVCKQTDKLC